MTEQFYRRDDFPGKTPGHRLTERIADLDPGDRIRVWFGQPGADPGSAGFEVTGDGRGRHPLVVLDPLFEIRKTTCTLEYDDLYADGTPYNLRVLAEPAIDGASVLAIEHIDG